MASPFEFSRRPAFIQTPMHSLSTPKLPKAPQHNPYDKFTQPEFDAWIGGITGALKRALGQEDEDVFLPEENFNQRDALYSSDEEVERLVEPDEQSSDEDLEDSFLHTRRVSKGKARDPREGPGFGKGGLNEPIVIGSESEEEENEESEDDDVSEEWDETSQSEEEVNSESGSNEAESSVHARIRHAQSATVLTKQKDEHEDEEEEFEEDIELSGENGEDDYDVQQPSSPILVASDEEGDVDENPPQIYVLEDEEPVEELSDEDDTTPQYTFDRIGPPRRLANLEIRVLSEEEADDVEEVEEQNIQPLDNDTCGKPLLAFAKTALLTVLCLLHPAFPPRASETEHVEIRDPWSGPKTYAEDYYSGGVLVGNPQNLTADRLGENDEVPERRHEQQNIGDIKKGVLVEEGEHEDKFQPLDNDTSFPPHNDVVSLQLEKQIEIRDPWSGPKTYAEDFYSGGDAIRTLQRINPDQIGENDDIPEGISCPIRRNDTFEGLDHEKEDIIDIDADDVQPLAEDTSFPPKSTADEQPTFNQPVEIPDHWAGPKTYAEDYYSGGVVLVQNGTLNPHCLGDNDESSASTPTPHLEPQSQEVGIVSNVSSSINQHSLNANAVTIPSDLTYESSQLDFSDEAPDAWDAPISDQEHIHAEDRARPPLKLLDICSGTDHDTAIVIDSEDEPDVVKEDPIADHKRDEQSPKQKGEDLDVAQLPPSSLPPPSTNVLSHGLHFLYETRAPTSEGLMMLQRVQPPSIPTIDWLYPFSDGMNVNPNPEGSSSNNPPVAPMDYKNTQFHEGCSLVPELTQPSSPEVVIETSITSKETEKVVALDESIADMETSASDLLEAEVDMPITHSTSPKSTEINLVVPTVNHDDGLNVDNKTDVIVDGIVVTPEIDVVQKMEGKNDSDQELDAGLNEYYQGDTNNSTQETFVEPNEVLEEDSATFVEIVSKEHKSIVDEYVFNPGDSLKELGTDAATSGHSFGAGVRVVDIEDMYSSRAEPPQGSANSALSPTRPSPKAIDLDVDVVELPSASTSSPDFSSPPLQTHGSISKHDELSTHDERHPSTMDLAVFASDNDILSPEQSEVQLSSNFVDLPTAATVSPYSNPWPGPFSRQVVMRKTSSTVLLADPFPASLSTPDDHPNDKLDALTDESFSEESSQDNSISSSSSLDQEREDKLGIRQLAPRGDQLRDEPTEVEADSDFDLDYIATAASPFPHPLPATSKSEVAISTKELDGLFTTTGVEATGMNEGNNIKVPQSSPLTSPVDERNNGASATHVRTPSEDGLPSILIIKKVQAGEQTSVKSKAGRPSKRKRSTSATASSQLSSSGSSKKPGKSKAPSRLPTKPRGSTSKIAQQAYNLDKGKGREDSGRMVSQGSFDARSTSSRSSSDTSTARRILVGSRSTSRASSIVSTTPSDNSISTVQPSPTLGKGSFSHQQLPPPPPPPSLLHRHHHSRPGTQSYRPAMVVKPPGPDRPADAASSSSPVSKQIISSQRHRPFSSSPVTRSNCRYHKISIPLDDESDDEVDGEEDVKLVYFLVPGCSLGNAELNRNEMIVDHGDATPADSQLMTPDLDAYAFNAPLLSVLRLLVGIDMLREGEIYYLPLPGSDWVPRKARETSFKTLHGHGDSGPAYVSPRRNSSISTISMPAPASTSTTSSTTAPQRSLKPLSPTSQTSSQPTDIENSPPSKRHKASPAQEDYFYLAPTDPDMPSDSDAVRDAHDHNSDAIDNGTNGTTGPHDEVASDGLRFTKGPQQGLKRSRTSDVLREHDVDAQKLKKQKTGSDLRAT
ncbi:hypothetical protein H0H87_008267 [Tephrocybe sp. NHM501043]|nr:hypothetical protein H0H87_008267 [Tephrocybe sp. NHM501043]